jgi:ERCC4-related helicase
VRNLWIEQIVWTTEEDEEVARYIPGIKASWVRVALPEQYEAIRQVIKRMIETTLAKLRIDGLPVPEEVNRKVLVGLMNRLRAEIEAGAKGPNMHYMALISAALSLYHALELIESQHVYSLRKYLEEIQESELRSHRMVAGMPEFRRLVMMANECNVDHTKVNALLTVLMAHLAEKKDDRVLVFANIRSTAEVLVERLKERGYRAALFVGKAEGKGGSLQRPSRDKYRRRGIGHSRVRLSGLLRACGLRYKVHPEEGKDREETSGKGSDTRGRGHRGRVLLQGRVQEGQEDGEDAEAGIGEDCQGSEEGREAQARDSLALEKSRR